MEFVCPNCKQKSDDRIAKDLRIGDKIKCPLCKEEFHVGLNLQNNKKKRLKFPKIKFKFKVPEWLKPDGKDIFFFAGLFGIGFGLWGYDKRLTFIVVGTILFAIAVMGYLPKKNK